MLNQHKDFFVPLYLEAKRMYSKASSLGLFGDTPFTLSNDGASNTLFGRCATNILNGFRMKHLFDSSLLRDRKFFFKEELVEVPGVSLFQRAAFISEVTRAVESRSDAAKKAFFMLDLAQLRAADLAVDLEGNHSADVILNSVVKNIISMCESVNKEMVGADGSSRMVLIPGRYAGDELIVGMVGDYTPKDLENIQNVLYKAVTSLKGFYLQEDGVTIKKKQVGLKNNSVTIIETGTEGSLEKRIFDFYFQRGLILDQAEMAKTKQKFADLNEFAAYEKEHEGHSIYPNLGMTVREKIEYLSLSHKELIVPMRLAHWIDARNESRSNFTNTVLQFIENNLYDRLLLENIQSFTDFQDRIGNDEFSGVWAFDLKFIKEINDGLSFVDGDKAIEGLWKSISGFIQEEDRKKFVFARRGGTFVLGVRKGEALSDQTLDAFGKLKSVALPELKLELPIGSCRVENNPQNLGEVLDLVEQSAYVEILRFIVDKKIDPAVQIFGEEDSPETKVDKVGLIHNFFSGKRINERSRKALWYLQTVKELSSPEFNNLRFAFQGYGTPHIQRA